MALKVEALRDSVPVEELKCDEHLEFLDERVR